MALELSALLYEDVRRVLDPTVESEAFSDELIASDFYSGRASRWVVAAIPTAESLTGSAGQAVQRALVYKTAAYLAERLPVVKQTKLPDQEAIFDTYDRGSNARSLHRMADEALAEASATITTKASLIPSLFTVADGVYR